MAISSPGWVNQAKKNIMKDLGEEETPGPSVEHLECTSSGSGYTLRGKLEDSGSLLGVARVVVVSGPLCPHSHSWAMGWVSLGRGQR